MSVAGFHHVELWVAGSAEEWSEWRWLLTGVGFALEQEWPGGQTWDAGAGRGYLTLTTSPNLRSPEHDRRRAGLNHLAFRAGDAGVVDTLMAAAPGQGWTPLYQDRYPHAGGPDHYAGWLENSAGFKVELVADPA